MHSELENYYHQQLTNGEGRVSFIVFSVSVHRPRVSLDRKESMTPNDSSISLSPSLFRRTSPSKRSKVLPPGHASRGAATDLLSPSHQAVLGGGDDTPSLQQQKQQRKLDPRSCAECGKVLFSDKTHLLHCQTHAKNEKQCWICATTDDDIRKHILAEHGNQKFTSSGFKVRLSYDVTFSDARIRSANNATVSFPSTPI